MRVEANATARGFEAKAISGTHTVLIALNCPKRRAKASRASRSSARWSARQHRAEIPALAKGVQVGRARSEERARPEDPSKPRRFYTDKFPVQSFLWGDYAASPGLLTAIRILPMYGKPGALTTDPKDEIKFEITTEKEWSPSKTHGVWFNRGAIASQKFAEEFGNKAPKNINDPKDPEVIWLSRGLLEACLYYISETSRATRCGSRPTSSPTRRSSMR